MKLSDALVALENGSFISRKGFKSGQYLYLDENTRLKNQYGHEATVGFGQPHDFQDGWEIVGRASGLYAYCGTEYPALYLYSDIWYQYYHKDESWTECTAIMQDELSRCTKLRLLQLGLFNPDEHVLDIKMRAL